MRPRITNKSAKTLDVLRFSFESAGAVNVHAIQKQHMKMDVSCEVLRYVE
ncbi:MAG: hypothetical protein GQ537_04600 [Gammaproteobacteria bacterium]|nr:hypothetical protein [Gammaproteobacteria bacterium]